MSIQVCLNEAPRPFSRGDNTEINDKSNPLPQNHWVNFNHAWHKASLDDGNAKNDYTLLERGGGNDEYKLTCIKCIA